MCSGLVCISNNVGAVNEYLIPNECGLLANDDVARFYADASKANNKLICNDEFDIKEMCKDYGDDN